MSATDTKDSNDVSHAQTDETKPTPTLRDYLAAMVPANPFLGHFGRECALLEGLNWFCAINGARVEGGFDPAKIEAAIADYVGRKSAHIEACGYMQNLIAEIETK